jgi:preprotein translocase subunit SecB
MRPSIIQLKRVFFQRFEVEAIEPPEGTAQIEAEDFDFEGITFRVSLDAQSAMTEEDVNPHVFFIILHVAIDQDEKKPAPYKIDISALGIIEIAEVIEPEKRRDLALVNGASLVYGAMRELVTTVTARCIPGPLVLPTTDFRDHSKFLQTAPPQDVTEQ